MQLEFRKGSIIKDSFHQEKLPWKLKLFGEIPRFQKVR